jgi:hypothetical protein
VYDADSTRGPTARRRRSGRRRERREAGGTMWGEWSSPQPRVVLEGRSVLTPRADAAFALGFVAARPLPSVRLSFHYVRNVEPSERWGVRRFVRRMGPVGLKHLRETKLVYGRRYLRTAPMFRCASL